MNEWRLEPSSFSFPSYLVFTWLTNPIIDDYDYNFTSFDDNDGFSFSNEVGFFVVFYI